MSRLWVFRWLSGSAAALAAALALVLILADRGSGDGTARYNLIVLTVESFRADAVNETLTPRLLALVAERDGIRFRNHRSVSAWTVPNIVALLSGTHPVKQGIVSRGQSLRGPPWNGLTDGLTLTSFQPFALIESYDGLGLVREPGGLLPLALAGMAGGNGHGGLWYHYLDTHLPHRPTLEDDSQPSLDDPAFGNALGLPPPRDAAEAERRRTVASQPVVPVEQVRFPESDGRWIEAFYQSEIRAFDRWFERFFDIYVRTGLIRNTVLVVTADHGEELGEASRVGHASTTREAVLNDAVLNVPLFIWTPDADHRNALRDWAESGVLTDHVDLGGTLPVLVGGAPGTGGTETAPHQLLPRTLTGKVVESPRFAFTSAAGYAEPDPAGTAYFLLSREDGEAGRRTIRLDWASVIAGEGAGSEPMDAVASAITLPAAREPGQGQTGGVGPVDWIWPRISGEIGFSDIRDRSRVEWTGDPAGRYTLEYAAGTGAMAMDGTIAVEGNGYTFGRVDRDYWDTFVVPYGRVRIRVRNDETGEVSEWLTLKLR